MLVVASVVVAVGALPAAAAGRAAWDTGGSAAWSPAAATMAAGAVNAGCATYSQSPQSFGGAVADVVYAGPAGDLGASIDWGDGTSSSGSVVARGSGYLITGSHVYGSTGVVTITTTVEDGNGASSTADCTLLVYGKAPGGGAFVVGDGSASGAVTFWGAQWSKINTVSGGSAPSSFKGFVPEAVAAPSCNANGAGPNWATRPGNSTPPPAGPLPAYMAVIVSSSIDKSGPVINGNTARVVIVRTDPGYEGNPGHAGTGTVVGTVQATGCDL